VGSKRVNQCFAIRSCRPEAKIGCVLICQQMMAHFVRKGETSPTRISGAVDQGYADSTDPDVAAVNNSRPEVKRKAKKPHALDSCLQVDEGPGATSEQGPRLLRTRFCFGERRHARLERGGRNRERTDVNQQLNVTARPLQFIL
jgi:hypothetical protein